MELTMDGIIECLKKVGGYGELDKNEQDAIMYACDFMEGKLKAKWVLEFGANEFVFDKPEAMTTLINIIVDHWRPSKYCTVMPYMSVKIAHETETKE